MCLTGRGIAYLPVRPTREPSWSRNAAVWCHKTSPAGMHCNKSYHATPTRTRPLAQRTGSSTSGAESFFWAPTKEAAVWHSNSDLTTAREVARCARPKPLRNLTTGLAASQSSQRWRFRSPRRSGLQWLSHCRRSVRISQLRHGAKQLVGAPTAQIARRGARGRSSSSTPTCLHLPG